MSSKNPEKSLQRSESHLFWHEQGKGSKPQAAQAIEENEEDALFWIRHGPNRVALQSPVLRFLYKTSVSEQENTSQAVRYFLPPLQFLQVQT